MALLREEADVLWGWERFFTELSTFLNTAESQRETANEAYSQYVLEWLQVALLSLSTLLDHLRHVSANVSPQAEVVGAQYQGEIADLIESFTPNGNGTLITELGGMSQHHMLLRMTLPPVLEDRGTMYLRNRLNTSFSWTQIAGILGISRSTLYRRRVEYGLLIGHARGNITDQQLHSVLRQLHREMPAVGVAITWGRLRSMGFTVRRERLRCTIREIDPLHSALRWRGDLTGRRPYSVAGPNSLWHRRSALSIIHIYM